MSNPTNIYNPSFKEEILQWWFGSIVEMPDELSHEDIDHLTVWSNIADLSDSIVFDAGWDD